MPKFKTVVTDYVFESFDRERAILAAAGSDLVLCQAKSADELHEEVKDAHGILNTYLPGMDARLFDAAPSLKVIARYGIGVDTIDVPAATERGIVVANVPDYCIDEVADHAVALFLGLARKLRPADRKVREGEWSLASVKPLQGIADMTAGVVGFGRIGRAIAARARAFGAEIVFSDPGVEGDVEGARKVAFDELLTGSDAIFVQCPAVEATRHLFDDDAFAKMQKQPFLINTARGSIVDTDAVVRALEQDRIRGAGLDVLDDEEAVARGEHKLKTFENVLLTPHCAFYSNRAMAQLQAKGAEAVAAVLRGERPTSVLNPEVYDNK